MDPNVDHIQTFKSIGLKLKKRFLRKPNVGEGTEKYGQLAKTFISEDCPHYAALCTISQARCEHKMQNSPAEASRLVEAARQFLLENDSFLELTCPCSDENLIAAINCYHHAIKVLLDDRQVVVAASLLIELGDELKRVGKPLESLSHYHRAAQLLDECPTGCLLALDKLGSTEIIVGQYDMALETFTSMAKVLDKMSGGNKLSGALLEYARRSEIFRILLLLYMKPSMHKMKPEYSRLLEIYTWDSNDDKENGSCLDEDLFLQLQSLVLASQSHEHDVMRKLQQSLWPCLSPQQNHLFHLVMTKPDPCSHIY